MSGMSTIPSCPRFLDVMTPAKKEVMWAVPAKDLKAGKHPETSRLAVKVRDESWRCPQAWGYPEIILLLAGNGGMDGNGMIFPRFYPKNHPSLWSLIEHFSIESHGDLGISHFKKPPYNPIYNNI